MRTRGYALFTIAACVISLLFLWLFCAFNAFGLLVVTATVGAILFVLGIRYSIRHLPWLIVALVLAETLPYLSAIPLDPNSRWFLRYPLLLPLCLPALWVAYCEGVLFEGRFKLMLLLFLWDAVTISYSSVPAISAGRLVPNFLLFSSVVLVASNVNDAEDVQKILGYFVGACGLLTVLTGVAWLGLPFNLTHAPDEQGLLRFTGLASDPNAVGSLSLATIGATLAHWRKMHGWKRIGAMVLISASLVFAAMADSRSETGMILFGFAAFAVWKWRLKAIIVCVVLIFAAVSFYSRLSAGTQAYFNRGVSTFTGRTDAWRFELQRLKEHPLRGFGYQSEGEIFQNRYFNDWQEAWNRGPNTPLHNDYMSVAIDTGLPALVFWLAIVSLPWLDLLRSPEDPWELKPLFFLFVLPMFILAFDESGLSEPRSVRGILFFLSWALAERYQIVRATNEKALRDSARTLWTGLLGAPARYFTAGSLCLLCLFGAASHAQAESSSSAAPAYFSTLPPGAPLPSGEQCAAWIKPTAETVPENAIANHTKPTASELAKLRTNGYHFTYMDDNNQYARIDGNYTGSTDMILRWAACKYGIDENVMRAQAWQESMWKQATHGDLHRNPQVCRGGTTNLWGYDGCPLCCWQSWSILQTKVVPYEWMTWPAIRESTPFAADYRAADQRSCMNGYYRTYFHDHPSHDGHAYWTDISDWLGAKTNLAYSDVVLRGCIGKHYSGDWYDPAARNYIRDVWRLVDRKPWLKK